MIMMSAVLSNPNHPEYMREEKSLLVNVEN